MALGGAERVPLGGTDPGADYSGAATLASVSLPRATVGGYTVSGVEDFRRRALNTIAYLEAQVEALQVQNQSLRSVLEAGFGPSGLGRALAYLAKALNQGFGQGQERGRTWAAQQLAAIISAPTEVEADEAARAFPAQLAKLLGPGQARVAASQFVDTIVGDGQ